MPKVSVGFDSSASVKGPLANLAPIARREAVTGSASAPPPDGRNYSVGLAFGNRDFTAGLRVHGNNIAGGTLDDSGPQYISGAAALELRYSFLRYKGLAATGIVAPTRTLLIDSTDGTHTWGNGVRYGGSASYTIKGVGLFADVYQEQVVFGDGPAEGNSTRNGITLGLSFQP